MLVASLCSRESSWGEIYSLVLLLSAFLASKMKIVFSGVLGASYLMTRGSMNERPSFIFYIHKKNKLKFLCTVPGISFIPQKIQLVVSLRSMHLILIKMSKNKNKNRRLKKEF